MAQQALDPAPADNPYPPRANDIVGSPTVLQPATRPLSQRPERRRRTMRTDYWINAGRIYGPAGFTGYFIDNGHKIIGRRGYTRHWVYQKSIYSSGVGNTGFRIEENRIHGPLAEPPWERPVH